jgi:O-antigen/teichoic acid export membrane protein
VILPSLILNLGRIAAAGLGFLFHLIAARSLGAAGYGAFTASLALVSLWALVMEGGIGVALTRQAAADRQRLAWFPRMVLWRTWLALGGVAGAVVSAIVLGFPPHVVGLVAIMAVGMAATSSMWLGYAVFRSMGWFTWEAVVSALQKLILVLLTAAALPLATSPVVAALAFTSSLVIGGVIAITRAWQAVGRVRAAHPSAQGPPSGFFLRSCVPLLLIQLLTMLYLRIDQILLLQLRGPEETGLYAVAFRPIEALLFIVGGTMTVLFPRLARSVQAAPMAFRADFVRAWQVLWVGGLIIAVNGWLWAAGWLPFVFGRAYAPAETQLHLLLGALPFAYVSHLSQHSLVAAGRERSFAILVAGCAGVNLGLNVLLIPRWGATGAACATLGTEAVLLAGCVFSLGEIRRSIPLASTLAAAGLAALAVGIGWWVLPASPWGRVVLALAVSVACWQAGGPWSLARLRARSRSPRYSER